MRVDLTQIQRWILKQSKVLDLGCGDGEFLAQLRDSHSTQGLGLEIDPDNITQALSRGIDVV